MQNLLALLKRYRNLLLFLLLQGISLALLVSNNNFHKATFLNSTKTLTNWINASSSSITRYFSLKQSSDKVFRQSTLLKEQLFNNDSISDSVWVHLIDTNANIQYDYIPAQVVSNTTKFQKNYLVLNVGESDQIDPKKIQGVVGPDGVVGFTRKGRATSNYVSVVSLLNTSEGMEIDVMHENSGHSGQLIWGDDDDRRTATVLAVPNYVDIKVGHRIVTNGLGGQFPKGELVGWIKSAEKESGTNNYSIKISLATDFNSLQHVHVIRNVDTYQIDSLQIKDQVIKVIPNDQN